MAADEEEGEKAPESAEGRGRGRAAGNWARDTPTAMRPGLLQAKLVQHSPVFDLKRQSGSFDEIVK
jgi:hypothetical protein